MGPAPVSLLRRAAGVGGGFAFAIGGIVAAAEINARSWAGAALAGAVALAGLAVLVSVRRLVRRRRLEHRAAAIEAIPAAEEYRVQVRWRNWWPSMAVAVGGVVVSCVVAFVAWRSHEPMVAAVCGLFILIGSAAVLVLLQTGLPANQADYFLRLDHHGMFHFAAGYVPWSRVTAVDVMWQWADGYTAWPREYDYFLVLTLRASGWRAEENRAMRSVASPSAAFISGPGCVILPLRLADEDPRVVLAAARAFAGRAGVPVPESLEILSIYDPPRPQPKGRSLALPAAVAVFGLFVVFLLSRGAI